MRQSNTTNRNTFQSTPPARGATTSVNWGCPCWLYFNPRPPRGGRPITLSIVFLILGFQSTPPARGATWLDNWYGCRSWDFNPRPPRGGRPRRKRRTKRKIPISIHAPREGGDQILPGDFSTKGLFQSTPPARGATIAQCVKQLVSFISIHAPREGGDRMLSISPDMLDISIHAPREGGDQRIR